MAIFTDNSKLAETIDCGMDGCTQQHDTTVFLAELFSVTETAEWLLNPKVAE